MIITVPDDTARHPLFFLIQGIGSASIDEPLDSESAYSRITDKFARNGYATVRVERPGVGASTGGPYEQVDFESELDAFRQALRYSISQNFCDSENVFLFGHSIGGVLAPILASEMPVKGIAVYGTLVRTFSEYCFENVRRQLSLAGFSAAGIDTALRDLMSLLNELVLNSGNAAELVASRSELTGTLDLIAPTGLLYGRASRFWSQLAQKNMPAFWSRCDSNVLALWGESDFLSSGWDHEKIVEIVEQSNQAKSRYMTLPNCDHAFKKCASMRDSYLGWTIPEDRFDSQIVDILKDWADSLLAAD
ncbi:MAG: alpha/beta hydrolase [Thermoleophilia bacterium]